MLSSVIFDAGSQLKRIEPGAFKECKIHTIVLPFHVEFIAEDAFSSSCHVTRTQQPDSPALEAGAGGCCDISSCQFTAFSGISDQKP
jgi:hypothetical protein